MLKFCETVHEDVLGENTVPVCTVRMLDGPHVLLSVSGRLLEAISLEDEGGGEIVSTVTFPHLIRGVFPHADANHKNGRAYVLLDGPDPFIDVDVATGVFHAVYDLSMKDVLLKRWNSDAVLDCLTATPTGTNVAVARSDSTVILYRVVVDNLDKLIFETITNFSLGRSKRATSMAFTGVRGDHGEAQFLCVVVRDRNTDLADLVCIDMYTNKTSVMMADVVAVAPISSNTAVAAYVRRDPRLSTRPDRVMFLDAPSGNFVWYWDAPRITINQITCLPSIAAFTDYGIISASGCGPRACVAAKSGDKDEIESSTDVGYGDAAVRWVFPVAHGRAVVVSGRTVTHVEWLRATHKRV